MSKHILTVEPDGENWAIECPDGNGCHGWIECTEEHPEGSSEGPWKSPEDAPWYEQEDFTFHGVEHTWKVGHVWTVPYVGCVVQGAWDVQPPEELYVRDAEGFWTLTPGRYEVDDDWDDTDVSLSVIPNHTNGSGA